MASRKPAKPVVNLESGELAGMSGNERIKAASQGLFYVVPAKGERDGMPSRTTILIHRSICSISSVVNRLNPSP